MRDVGAPLFVAASQRLLNAEAETHAELPSIPDCRPSPWPTKGRQSDGLVRMNVDGLVLERGHATLRAGSVGVGASSSGADSSFAFRTSSIAERLLMVAPIGSGFFSLSFQRENVVG